MEGLILSKALKTQNNLEESNAQIAINNLRSEVIELRHKNEEKENTLNILTTDLTESQSKLHATNEKKDRALESAKLKDENYEA